MRIAIDARMAETRGGIGTYTRELISQLAEIDRKNQYFIITNKKGNDGIGVNAANFLIIESLITRRHYFIKDLWHQLFLPFFLKINHIDIYFNPRYILTFFSGNSKLVVTIHDMIAFLRPEIWPGISGFRIRQYIKISSKRADKILTVSNSAKDDIMRILNIAEEKIQVIHCGINKKLYRPDYNNTIKRKITKKYGIDKKFIFAPGPMGRRKNHDRLIQAYSGLPNFIKEEYQLVITGEKKGCYQDLLKIISQLNLQEEIIFPGFIPEEEMPVLVNAASLFIFPSLYEGFGIPLLEAMACGTPILASNVSSIPEVCGNAALLFDPQSIQEMVDAIERLISDEVLRKQLVQRGFLRIKKYSWKNSAKALLDTFEEIYKVVNR